MLYQKYITFKEFENEEMKDEYQYLYKKDGELKGDSIEDDAIVEFGNEFLNSENIHSKQ